MIDCSDVIGLKVSKDRRNFRPSARNDAIWLRYEQLHLLLMNNINNQ